MKTIQEQTGWKRPYPKMICQNSNILKNITEYNYDLTNTEFINYFRSRTGILLHKCEDVELEHFLLNSSTSKAATNWLLNSPEYKYHTGVAVSKYDRLIDIEINKVLRGKLQDCWELFSNNK